MKFVKTLLAILGLLAAFIMIAPAPAQAAPFCGITWGSLAKVAGTGSTASITNVRAGQHACFDRMVVDVQGRASGYSARYVSAVTNPGSGATVPLRGGAFLQVDVLAPAYNSSGLPTYLPANRSEVVNTSGYSTFRQVSMAASYEGRTTLGLGVRARLPFNVFVLDGPGTITRIVIDVAHRW